MTNSTKEKDFLSINGIQRPRDKVIVANLEERNTNLAVYVDSSGNISFSYASQDGDGILTLSVQLELFNTVYNDLRESWDKYIKELGKSEFTPPKD